MGSCEKVESLLVSGPIIVGAGPSGLAASACLSINGVPSLILEKCDCIASLWQYKAYDILKLHLPKKFCQLPHLDFPQYFPKYPTKQQFISYMESYARHFSIHPKFNQEVRRAEFDQCSGVWRVSTQDYEYVSQWLIVATGENAEPFMPQIPGLDKFHGPIKHTSFYRSGSEFENQKVLVVGCGNSGMEVSFDLCRNNANPHLVVRDAVHVLPREIFCLPTFGISTALLRWLPVSLVDKLLLLMANIKLGNTARYGIRRPKTGPIELKNVAGKSPVLDVGTFSMIKSGKIKVRPGLKEIKKDGAEFVNGEGDQFEAIILATGYRSNVPKWLKSCDFFTKEGMPKKPFPKGWKEENGLYTVGFTGRGLFGSSCDAVKVANDVAEHWRDIKDCTIERFAINNPHIIKIL